MKNNNPDLPIFFILGRGRSGSTLLQMMLDAHPNIQIPVESRFFIFLHKKYARRKKWNKKSLESFHEDLFLEGKINFIWKIDRKKLKREILSQPVDTNFAKLCKIIYNHHISLFPKKETRLLGDKNPINALFAPWLYKVFPNAKFVHLIRDPRATCLSHLKAGFHKKALASSLMWMEYNKTIEKVKARVPDQFFTIHYEDLVERPEYWLKKITGFLELDFHPSMLEYHKTVDERLKAKKTIEKSEGGPKLELYLNFHKNTGKPINADSINLWKDKLTIRQIKQIEGITADKMERYGYKASFGSGQQIKPSILQKTIHFIRKCAIKIYYNSPISWRKIYTNISTSVKLQLFKKTWPKK